MPVLAFDTSAYTTSLALVDLNEQLIWEGRRMLPVGKGERGLRQSEAVFAHLKNLSLLWEGGAGYLKGKTLRAVAAATRPRPVSGSYMPVFKVGQAFGSFAARTMGLQFMETSHQEGHVTAGLWSAGLTAGCRYLAVHLSGGTTEILSVLEDPPGRLRIEILGGSADLKAGQFVDRLGVALGFEFPAGKMVEELARRGSTGAYTLPVAVTGMEISFSGPASQAERCLKQGFPPEEIARAAEVCLADSLARALESIPDPAIYEGLLLVGGVSSNRFIRQRLAEKWPLLPLSFAGQDLAGDNAVGVAVQAVRNLLYL